MSSLKCITNNEVLVVDSRLIAEELDIQHKNLLELIRKYDNKIKSFGLFAFETEKPTESSLGGRPEVFCYLNEEQATFIMTLSRNTEKVVNCKLKLVKAFSEAKKQLAQPKEQLPQTYLEALKALVASEEAKELLKKENEILEEENKVLAETVDELFDYSSIIRIAKLNNVSETNFSWRRLKAASELKGLEIKKVPDPRFGYKNLYSHEVWRYLYPQYKLPETTTLVIRSN